MSDTEAVAGFMAEMLSILGIYKIPDTIISQVASRMEGTSSKKPNSLKSDLKKSLAQIKVETMKTFQEPEIVFDISTKANEFGEEIVCGKTRKYKCSEVLQDVFTLVEKLLIPELRKIGMDEERPAVLDTPEGFEFVYKMICKYQVAYIDSNDREHDVALICLEVRREVFGDKDEISKSKPVSENLPDTFANLLTKYQRLLNKRKACIPFQALRQKYGSDFKFAFPFLELPVVAEAAIRLIMQYGFTYEKAGWIYNKQFNCAYEPISSDVTLICVKCNKVNRFPEVHLNEKCVCGEPLFRKCRKKGCGMPVSRMVDVCPGCGMRESDYIRFEAMLPQVKAYAERGCVEQAETGFVYAQSLAPDRQEDLREIQKQIDSAKASRTETLNKLGELINQRLFYAASERLAETKKKFPSDVLQNVESRIVTAQNLADEMFSKADRTVDAFQKVLAVCADHPGALREIHKIPPKPPARLNASVCEGYIQLSWEASSESGIQYRIIRKRNSAPATVFDSDGKFDIRTEKTYAKDLSPVTGKVYYAVFAERDGILSSGGAVASLLFLPEVSNFSLCQLKDGVEISYRLPEGASGVRVERKNGTENTVVYEGLNTAVIDRTVLERCAYTVTVIFDKRESNGKTSLFTSTVFPKEIKPQIRSEQKRVQVSWDIRQKEYGVRVLEQIDEGFFPEQGRLYSISELEGKTQTLARASGEDLSVSFEIKPNRRYVLLVMVGDSKGWLCCGEFSEVFEVYPGVERMPVDVNGQGEHTFVFESNLPEGVHGFSYLLSKKNKIDPDSRFTAVVLGARYNRTDKPMFRILTAGQPYVGKYYIFYRFQLENGAETALRYSEIYFLPQIQATVSLKVKKARVTGHIDFQLEKYDFEGDTSLPELCLRAGNEKINLKEINLESFGASPSRPRFSIRVDEQLSVLADSSSITLEPVDKVFVQAFTIYDN